MAGVILTGFKIPNTFIEAWYKHYHGVPAMMTSKKHGKKEMPAKKEMPKEMPKDKKTMPAHKGKKKGSY